MIEPTPVPELAGFAIVQHDAYMQKRVVGFTCANEHRCYETALTLLERIKHLSGICICYARIQDGGRPYNLRNPK